MIVARYFDPTSMSVVQATLDVVDEAAARDVLKREGKQLLSAEVLAVGLRARWSLGSEHAAAVSSSDIPVFCRELRALVVAGLSVVEALEALAEGHGGRSTSNGSVYARLLARLQCGKSLSAAMADMGGFPALLIASVQSSERTSNLPEALSAYLQFDDMVSRLGALCCFVWNVTSSLMCGQPG
jgi:general secretion pathway protein F